MASLDALKRALRQKATEAKPSETQPLSRTQYSAGFDILSKGPGCTIYQDFIVPQLTLLLGSRINTRLNVSVLEIGPGPQSVLGYLPAHLKHKIKRYAAFEPNDMFAARLEEWLSSAGESALGGLESPPEIHRVPFTLDSTAGLSDGDAKFDLILFCHSMYGMKPKRGLIERALRLLLAGPQEGMVVVFHRDGALDLAGLFCCRTASFPAGIVRVADDDQVLDCFASFIAGLAVRHVEPHWKALCAEWRKVCRGLGGREASHPGQVLFRCPNVMVALTKHATSLPELTSKVPCSMSGAEPVKNREARTHHPAAIVRPTNVQHVQQCVRWALEHGAQLAVISGGHSGHCLQASVVSVDMGAMDKAHVLAAQELDCDLPGPGSLVVAEAGCKTGDIVRKGIAAGVAVPLGARPSLGAGLWLQGGIGHLARLHGLACDAVVGAVVVGVESGQVLCVGHVPRQHRPAGAVRPRDEAEVLWAVRGAGSNFGIVLSVTFRACAAPTYSIRNWVVPLDDGREARRLLGGFDGSIACKLPRACSADAYLYWEAGRLHLGISLIQAFPPGLAVEPLPLPPSPLSVALGPAQSTETVDGIGLFETEMYMSGMHNGHGAGKTSSFKRCIFVKQIGAEHIADMLVSAIETRPSPLCYLHLLQGGGAVGHVPDDATAFGCRDWDFACVVTGVWPRAQDGTETARAATQWVYRVAMSLLPLSSGAYGADLGPDPQDGALACKAFGPNRRRLARLKHSLDPHNVLAYACPLPAAPAGQQLIVLVTGEAGVGKDYCADIWAAALTTGIRGPRLRARAVSISEATKREYAAAAGADLDLLLRDRVYKERHRPALTAFFRAQMQLRPRLAEQHFLDVVSGAADVDVLLVTGMRDEAPVSALSHLVPSSRLLDVRVEAGKETRRMRRGWLEGGEDAGGEHGWDNARESLDETSGLEYRSSLVFDNDGAGSKGAERFFEHHLLPFFHGDLQRLASMVRRVPGFPHPGIEFRHVLDISQQPGGLNLCSSLMQAHFSGDWAEVGVVACCEAGGFVYGSALAARVDIPLALIRQGSKLPPPTVSVVKSPSHISSWSSSSEDEPSQQRIEMSRDLVPSGASVVVIDDVLATGKTLCAVLRLLQEAAINTGNISVMVAAEFPIHRGREMLRRHGFGGVNVQSLLVFGGV